MNSFLKSIKKPVGIIVIVTLALLAVIAIVGFIRFNFTNGGDIVPGKNANAVQLICTNEYLISALYYSPNQEGIMEKLSLTVKHSGSTKIYEMVPAMAASGAKFETTDQSFSFWEHQGEFRLSQGENDLSLCQKSTGPIDEE
ncbi:MAG: MliC family protein [Candidatus Falkowbacteria bacterium]|nr:MliC family protein [Candidatus Falkowbacteria bacterium]